MKKIVTVATVLIFVIQTIFAQDAGRSNAELRESYLRLSDGFMPSELNTDMNYIAVMADKGNIFNDADKTRLDEAGINFLKCYKMYFAVRELIDKTFAQNDAVTPSQLEAIQIELKKLDDLGREVMRLMWGLWGKIELSLRWQMWEHLTKEKLGDRLPGWEEGGAYIFAASSAWRLGELASDIDYLAKLLDDVHVIDISYSDVLDRVGMKFLEGQFLYYETTKLKDAFEKDPLKPQSKKHELNKRLSELAKLEKDLERDFNTLLRLVPKSERWKAWGEKVTGDKNSNRPDGEWCGSKK